MALSKGLSVISGSSDYVFKVSETGFIRMGSDITQARIVVTGSMTMDGDFVLNGTNVTDEMTRLDTRIEEVYNDLDLGDLDSVKELANLFKVTSSVHYSSDSTIYGWQTHLIDEDAPLTSDVQNIIDVYFGDLDDPIEDSVQSSFTTFQFISRGVQPGWEFDKTSDANTTLPSTAAIEWVFYKDYNKDKNLSVSDLSNGYAVIVLDETGEVPRFDVYTHPESSGNINSKFASRWEYAASGNETFNAGEKILLYFGDTAPQVHQTLRRVQLSLTSDDGSSIDPNSQTALWNSSTSKGPMSSSEIVKLISLRTLSSQTPDFLVQRLGYTFNVNGVQKAGELQLEIAPATEVAMISADNSLAAEIVDLDSKIDDEQTSRILKDASLEKVLSAEVHRAKSTEAVLDTKIDTVSSSLDTKIGNVSSSLDTKIGNVSSSFASDLGAEASRAKSTELVLDGRITTVSSSFASDLGAEASRAKSAETVLDGRITTVSSSFASDLGAEVSRAKSTELVLDGRITTVSSSLSNRIKNVEDDIEAIVSGSATDLDSLLEVVNAFKSADSQLSGTISSLTAARQAALSSETYRAESAESVLDARIDTVSSSLNTKISNVSSDLSTETYRAESAETILDTKIDNVSSSLNTKIGNVSSSLNTKVDDASNSLNTKIGNVSSSLNTKVDDVSSSLNTKIGNVSSSLDTKIGNVSSSLDTRIGAVSSDLSTETYRAKSAEAALDSKYDDVSGSLSSEVARAKDVESTLSSSLSAEIKRASAKEDSLNTALQAVSGTLDNILSGSAVELDSLLEVVEAFKSADSQLSGTISTLTSAREAALSSEVYRAKAAESVLSSSLATEVTRAKSAESVLSSSLATEVTRAKSVESVLDAKIDTVSSSLNTTIGTVSSSILSSLSTEVYRAKSAESSIVSKYDAVSSSLVSSLSDQQTLSSSLSAEISRAKYDESIISSSVSVEVYRAKDAESILSSSISAEVYRAKDTESTISSSVSAEVYRAKNAESALSSSFASSLSAEATSLDSRITAVSGAFSGSVYSLSNKLGGGVQSIEDRLISAENSLELILSGSSVDLDSLIEVVEAFRSSDSQLSGTISALTSAREAALSSEVYRAKSAEAALDTKIGNVSSSLNTKVDDVSSSLDTKIGTVSSDLNTKIGNVSSSLNNRIDTVSSSLDNRIDTVSSSLDNRIDTVSSSFASDLSVEVHRAKSTESVLNTRVSTVSSSFATLISDLDSDFTTLSSSVANNVELNGSAFETLSSSLNSAFASLSSSVASNVDLNGQTVDTISSSLSAEVSRAVSKEGSLDVRLSAVSGAVDSILSGSAIDLDSLLEVVEAFRSSDSQLSGTISALTSAREAALSTEVFRAESAETSLGTRIGNVSSSLDGEVTRAKSAEITLNSRISTVSSSLSSSILAEETRAKSVETRIQGDLDTLEARTIVFNGTDNELEVSGSGVENNSVSITLGNSGNSITLGLPSDVTIGNNLTVTNNLVVSGSVVLGDSPSDLTKVEGQFRISTFGFADIPSGYKNNAEEYAGHMFYLSGSGQDGSNFPFANKWYFNENGVWITHPIYVFDDESSS